MKTRAKQQPFLLRAAATLLLAVLTTMTAWADTETVSYIDADGKTKTVTATVLTGNEPVDNSGSIRLAPGWYVVSEDVSYSSQLNLDGNVNLILADGKTMTASGVGHGIGGDGFLTIYGQTLGTGTLNATGTDDVGIYVVDGVTINGGTVNATGIMADGNVTINGGKVTSTGDPGILSNSGNIILGWTSPADRITADSYISYSGTVKVADGQGLTDGSGISYSGTLTADEINEKTLQPHWAGNGSSDSPYTISRPQELDLLAYRVNGTHGETLQSDGYSGKYFRLGADITYNHSTDWDDATSEENNYEAIGGYYDSNDRYFRGDFDGAGHTISGIRIYRSGTGYANVYQGIFGQTKGANIHGLRLADARITGYDYTGGIVGYNDGTVTDCHVANNVCIHAAQTEALYHGGIVGYNNGTVESCTSTATLTIASSATGCEDYGAIVGYNNFGTLRDNLAIGATVPAADSNTHGAIVGYNTGNGTLQRNYYTACTVAGVANATDKGCQNADVTANDGAVSAHVVILPDGVTATATTGIAYDGNFYTTSGTTITLSNTAPAPAGYQYDGYTASAGTLSGSTLTMPAADVTISVVLAAIPWAGDGSSSSPYIIEYPSQLDLLAHRVNGTHGQTLQSDGYKDTYFQLANDITYSHTTDWDDKNSTENNFEAIGYYYDGTNYRYFSGNFDGAGHTISGIRIHHSGSTNADRYQGIFGRTGSGANIHHLRLDDARITGYARTSGIVGYNYGGSTVTDCHVASDVCIHAVQSNADYHGGIVGYNEGTVANSTSAATLTIASGVTGCQYYGAIAGYNTSGTLRDNLAIGATVPAARDNYHGAIAGRNNSGTLQRNYYTACTVAGVANATDKGCQNADVNGARHAVSIVAAEGVTIVPTGTATTYAVSGITTHEGNNGISYGGQFYAGATEQVELTLTNTATDAPEGYQYDGYTASAGTLDGSTLTMPDADVTISLALAAIPWAGDGSSSSPYIIEYPSQLDLLAHRVNGTHGETADEDGYSGKYFRLGADITYTYTKAWNEATTEDDNNYEAIGYYDGGEIVRSFRGDFDGAGHTISGIRIYRSGNDDADKYQGIFGLTDGANIHGLRLADARITGYDNTGGIVGNNYHGTVTDCHVASNVCIHAAQSNAWYHGGIAGDNAGTVENSTSAATLTIPTGATGCECYGAIAGNNSSTGTLRDNLAIGATVPATGNSYYGAIAGRNNNGGTLQRNYYTACNVAGVANATNVGCSNADVTDNDGAVPGYFITLGENLSIASGATTFVIPAHGETAAVTYHVAAEGAQVTLSTGCEGYQMHNVTYNDGTADHTVSPDGDGKYIFTMPAANVSVTANVGVILWAGTGDKDDPYIIEFASQLDLLAHRVNGTHGETLQSNGYSGKYFRLGADITYNHSTDWDDATSEENNYEAIGGYYGSTDRYFRGDFDGAGHTISGIRIHRSGTGYANSDQGIFGQTDGANIHGLRLADARITGYDDTGGIVGFNDGTVTDCHVASNVCIHTVQSGACYHGGIAGYNYGGTVENCTSAATLTIASSATSCGDYGAIAGYNYATLSDNLAIGTTVPAAYNNTHGAIVGRNYGTLLRNYYTACKVASENVTPSDVGCANADVAEMTKSNVTYYDGAVPALRDQADNTQAIALLAALASTDNGHTPVDLGWGAGKYPMQLAGRTLYKDGAWNTLCLPFDVTVSGSVLDGAEVKTLTGSDFSDGTLTLNFSTTSETTLTAGKPYLVRWTKPDGYDDNPSAYDLVSPVFTGVTASTATANVETDYVDFIGTYSPTVLYEDGTEKTNLYMGSANKLYYPTVEGFKLNACRGYFKLKGVVVNGNGNGNDNGNGNGNGVRSFNINFGDDATGIVEMRDEKGEMRNGHEYEDGGWYTVDGRRLDGKPVRRGLYIHNGKRVVIK